MTGRIYCLILQVFCERGGKRSFVRAFEFVCVCVFSASLSFFFFLFLLLMFCEVLLAFCVALPPISSFLCAAEFLLCLPTQRD